MEAKVSVDVGRAGCQSAASERMRKGKPISGSCVTTLVTSSNDPPLKVKVVRTGGSRAQGGFRSSIVIGQHIEAAIDLLRKIEARPSTDVIALNISLTLAALTGAAEAHEGTQRLLRETLTRPGGKS